MTARSRHLGRKAGAVDRDGPGHCRSRRRGGKTGGDLAKRFRTRGLIVTAEERRAVQKENFKDDEWFWCAMQDLSAASPKNTRA